MKLKSENIVNEEKDMEYKYRVNAISDEVVDDTKSGLSVTSSSMVDDSFLSCNDENLEREEKHIPIANAKKKSLPTKSIVRTRAKKGEPSTKANNFLSRRKEDHDSVGVSFNSNINSFNDDLSDAFAPAVGKWLW